MARQRIVIRQAVHGYVEGHRELWNSAQLKQWDSKTVLIYSDTSSSGLPTGEGGYLTGYPLPESGYYALARTWPAPEMQRPGAVWTHTLFIEFADVARLRDATTLLTLFRRPEGVQGAKSEPSREGALELAITDSEPLNFATESDEIWYRQLLVALYGSPAAKVVAVCGSDDATRIERNVLALWSQQWPRLRRAMRFCTLTTADRSTPKSAFDLQVVPESERGIRSKFPSATFAQDATVVAADWLDHLVLDSKNPRTLGLRDFLQQAGADLTIGRRAFVPLTRLYMALTIRPSGRNTWNEALSLVREVSSGEPSTAVQLVLTAAIGSASDLDASSLEFLLSNLALVDNQQLVENARALGVAVWRFAPIRLAQLWESGGRGRDVASSGLNAVELDLLLEGLPLTGEFADTAFDLRPELLTNAATWRADPALATRAIRAAARNVEIAPRALDQLIASQSTALIPTAFEAFGNENVWRQLATALTSREQPVPALQDWLQAGTKYPGTVAQVLATTRGLDRSALAAIARASHPDLVPNDFGDDPWVIAAQLTNTGTIPDDEAYLCSFLLARAFGPRSRSIVALVALALNTVSAAAAANLLSQSAWQLLVHQLPEAHDLQSWDRCQRLLAGIAQLYVRKGLSVASFGRLGRDDSDFACIVSAASKVWGGRGYLRDVRQAFKTSHDFSSQRRRIIEDAIGSWF
jgi:GTPase-associated protein 1, N-terminal domain type 1